MYLDVKGAAERLQVGQRTVYQICQEWRESMGKTGLAHIMIGGKSIRTSEDDIKRWYEQQKKLAVGR